MSRTFNTNRHTSRAHPLSQLCVTHVTQPVTCMSALLWHANHAAGGHSGAERHFCGGFCGGTHHVLRQRGHFLFSPSRVNSPPSCVVVPHRQHLGGGAGATGLWYTGSSSSSSPCDELLASCGTGGGGGGGRTAAAASSAWLCASHRRLRSAVYRRIDSSSSPSGRKRCHFSATTAAYAASTPVFVSRASRCARSAAVSCGLAP